MKHMELEDMVEYVEGLENPSDFPNIVRWLAKHGYSDSEIAKIIGGNGLRLLKAAMVTLIRANLDFLHACCCKFILTKTKDSKGKLWILVFSESSVLTSKRFSS